MNVLIFGRASNFGVDTIRKRHNVRHIIDISNITIPFPFNGKLYYGQEEINCSDYDCALFFQKGKTSNYIFRVLENHICVLGDPYVRSVMRDKLLSAVVMANAGLPVIESTFCSSTNHNLSLINADRIVGKPIDGAFGQGIWLSNKESVKNLIDANYILQPYIECNSSDERLHIVGGKLVCAMFRYSEKKGEFRSNIDLGGKAKNLELTEERHNIAKRIANDVCRL